MDKWEDHAAEVHLWGGLSSLVGCLKNSFCHHLKKCFKPKLCTSCHISYRVTDTIIFLSIITEAGHCSAQTRKPRHDKRTLTPSNETHLSPLPTHRVCSWSFHPLSFMCAGNFETSGESRMSTGDRALSLTLRVVGWS